MMNVGLELENPNKAQPRDQASPHPAGSGSSLFYVPDATHFLEAFGVAPVSVEGDEGVEAFEVWVNRHETLKFSFDVTVRSFMVRWLRDNQEILRIYREGASRITIEENFWETHLVVRFELGEYVGYLDVGVYPSVSVNDRLQE